MEDVLAHMEPEKKLRLINSAMKEFGENRFDKASTNVIVKDAGISKGLLYYYFKSKEELFEYLIAFSMTLVGERIAEDTDWDKGDLFERIVEIAKVKMKIMEQYPYLVSFSKNMYEGKSINDIKKLVETYIPNIYVKAYTYNIDYSLFREGVDVARVVKMFELFLNGYSEELITKLKQVDDGFDIKEVFGELNAYLKIYKEAFYK